jgi:hypothetical protein
MKTTNKTSTPMTTTATPKLTIKILMMGKRTCEMTFSDPRQAKDYFDFLRTLGVMANEPIKTIELV